MTQIFALKIPQTKRFRYGPYMTLNVKRRGTQTKNAPMFSKEEDTQVPESWLELGFDLDEINCMLEW